MAMGHRGARWLGDAAFGACEQWIATHVGGGLRRWYHGGHRRHRGDRWRRGQGNGGTGSRCGTAGRLREHGARRHRPCAFRDQCCIRAQHAGKRGFTTDRDVGRVCARKVRRLRLRGQGGRRRVRCVGRIRRVGGECAPGRRSWLGHGSRGRHCGRHCGRYGRAPGKHICRRRRRRRSGCTLERRRRGLAPCRGTCCRPCHGWPGTGRRHSPGRYTTGRRLPRKCGGDGRVPQRTGGCGARRGGGDGGDHRSEGCCGAGTAGSRHHRWQGCRWRRGGGHPRRRRWHSCCRVSDPLPTRGRSLGKTRRRGWRHRRRCRQRRLQAVSAHRLGHMRAGALCPCIRASLPQPHAAGQRAGQAVQYADQRAPAAGTGEGRGGSEIGKGTDHGPLRGCRVPAPPSPVACTLACTRRLRTPGKTRGCAHVVRGYDARAASCYCASRSASRFSTRRCSRGCSQPLLNSAGSQPP